MTTEQYQESQNRPSQGQLQYQEPPYYYEEDEISLLDMVLVLARNKRLILITTGIFVALGLFIAIFSPNKYNSSATLIREVTEGSSLSGSLGGLAALGQGLGLSLGGASKGLSAEAYPELLRSREVRLAVVRDTYYFPDVGDSLTLTAYFESQKGFNPIALIKKITIGLPGTIMQIFRGDKSSAAIIAADGQPLYPTEEEDEAMKRVAEMLSVNVDQQTGLMTVSISSWSPLFSANLTERFVNHLIQRVRSIRTQKSRENLEFIQERFQEAEEELRKAEETLAAFDDRYNNPQTAQLRTERSRLQRQVSFKSQLYSDMQAQMTQAEIELQRSEPVITVVEKPLPPLEKSSPNRKLIVILSLFLGGGLGVGLAFINSFIGNMEQDEEEKGKLQEIKNAFIPDRWRS
jgi:uncharacterized protein involved in exopolysaccharide biosynthesis